MEEGELKFDAWLDDIGRQFKRLTNPQRNRTLDYLVEISEAAQLYHLSRRLDYLLKRDFLALLPPELSGHILSYLDPKSLCTCCAVSKTWNSTINSCAEVWQRACDMMGVAIHQKNGASLMDALHYKEMYMFTKARIHSLRNKTAFEGSLLFGHADRIMAIYYKDGKLATGSDDHTVRIWDCETGNCLHMLRTHTVADVKFDDDRIVTASFNTEAAVWDIHTGMMTTLFQGHVAAVFSVDYNVDLDLLVTGSADSTVKVWSLSQGVRLQTLPQHRSAWIVGVCLYHNPEEQSYTILSRDNSSLHLWKMNYDHSINQMDEQNDRDINLIPGFQQNESSITYGAVDNHLSCQVFETSMTDFSVVKQRLSFTAPDHTYIQAFLGAGEQFDVWLLSRNETPYLAVVRHATQELVAKIGVPLGYRPSKRASTFTLADKFWLAGFDGKNDQGVMFAASLRDNSVFLFKWKIKPPAFRS